MPAAMPCKTQGVTHRKLVALLVLEWQNTHELLRPMNLRESVWKDLFTSVTKIILQEKEWIHWTTTILCTNLFLCFEQWKIPDATAAVVKEWEELEKYQHGSWQNYRNKKEVIAEATHEGKTVHFASLIDVRHLKNSELEPQFQKYKGRSSCTPRWHCSGSFAVFTEQGSSASQVTAAKAMDIISRLPGCARQGADAVSAYTQVKMENALTLLKIPKSECPDIWIRLPQHKWPRSWSSMEDPVEICVVIFWQDCFVEGNSRKFFLEHGWEKVPNWECLFVHRERTILIRVCGRYKSSWKETKHWPNVESTHERSWYGTTNNILWPCLFGLRSMRMSNKQRYFGQQKYVWIQKSQLELQKATLFRETWREHFLMVLWHGRSCKERSAWKDFSNRRTKQLDSYTKSQHHTLTTTNSRKKKWDLSENWQRFARKIVFKMLIFGAYW